MSLPLGYSIRLAIIKNVGRTQLECEFIDVAGQQSAFVPIPHPHSGPHGSGIFVGFKSGTVVLIAHAAGEVPYVVGTIPDRSFYFDIDGIENIPIDSPEYPTIKGGDVVIQSSSGAIIQVESDGNIKFDAGIGNSAADIELSQYSESLFIRTNNINTFTEAGRKIEGIIRRDVNEEESEEDTDTIDFLFGENYDGLLSDIGRSPLDEVHLRTVTIARPVVRNPALIEKRSITYEYANEFGVRSLNSEAKSLVAVTKAENQDDIHVDASARNNRRSDTLNLNLYNYNHLIEKTEGTVVDIYGNILDINRNKIRVPDVSTINTDSSINSDHGLRRMHSYLRRSIKYHFEINSRKEIKESSPSIASPGHNAINHSRWTIDVDGEGLTKINIPASSETGNIPVLGRYIVSRDATNLDSGTFKDGNKRDISLLQFGAKVVGDDGSIDPSSFAGQKISNSEYTPSAVVVNGISLGVTAGTAHHDLLNIAPSILSDRKTLKNNTMVGGKLRDPNADGGVNVPSMQSYINNKILGLVGDKFYQPSANKDANAGGRSIHSNLDGSLEMSIGADTVDRKSLVMDLAGGVVSHYGRDKNGRSLIHQTDGDIIIQVGGKGIRDNRFKKRNADGYQVNDPNDPAFVDRPGRIEIHLNRPGDAENQKIIIDENGITFDIKGNGVFKSTGDMTISAGGSLLLNAESIYTYGTVNDDIDGDRVIIGKENYVVRDGRKI